MSAREAVEELLLSARQYAETHAELSDLARLDTDMAYEARAQLRHAELCLCDAARNLVTLEAS